MRSGGGDGGVRGGRKGDGRGAGGASVGVGMAGRAGDVVPDGGSGALPVAVGVPDPLLRGEGPGATGYLTGELPDCGRRHPKACPGRAAAPLGAPWAGPCRVRHALSGPVPSCGGWAARATAGPGGSRPPRRRRWRPPSGRAAGRTQCLPTCALPHANAWGVRKGSARRVYNTPMPAAAPGLHRPPLPPRHSTAPKNNRPPTTRVLPICRFPPHSRNSCLAPRPPGPLPPPLRLASPPRRRRRL